MTSVIISVQVNLILSYSENNLLPTQDGLSEIARRNEASASAMLRVVLGFAWGLASFVIVSGFLGYGTRLSLYLAIGWWTFMGVPLLFWRKLSSVDKKLLCLVILALLTARWGYSWLISPPREAMTGLVLGLLYVPVIMTITTILFSGRSRLICVSMGVIMGIIAIIGSSREALAITFLNDWRLGPLVFFVFALYAWLLSNWIREREQLETTTQQAQGLALAANTDALTGAFNRRAVADFLEQNALSRRQCGVIFLDLDHFKLVNDTYGHDQGDSVLAQVADILHLRTREGDFVARWGGEEFLVIVTNVSAHQTADIAEYLRGHIEQATYHGVPRLTASFGVAHTIAGAQLQGAINRADQALYQAKASGRNRVVSD
jgi:diguanylate cyclase (GGDEF)-like protein